MRQSLPAVSLIAAALQVACVAYQEPLAGIRGEMGAEADDLGSIYVAVRRPLLDDPIDPFERPQWEDLEPGDLLEFRERNAEHVLSAFSESRLFAGVSYADEGDRAPTVVVKPLLPPPGGYCDGDDILIPFLTLGIFPMVCTRDHGVYLELVGEHLPVFACAWPRSEMAGWLPALLATKLGSWTPEPSRSAFIEHVRSCIVDQRSAFLPPRAPPEGPLQQRGMGRHDG